MENTKTVTVELTDEQYTFLTQWQKTHEQELGIEVPLTAMVRKAIDGTMKAQKGREERDSRPPRRDGPSFGRRDDSRSGPRPGGRFGDKPSFGGRSGGGRPSMGRGPKFDMLDSKRKVTRKFEN